VTRAFNRKRQLALMLRAGSRYAAGDNLPLLRSELHEALIIFVIDVNIAALAEPAAFSSFDFFYW
jgi:hypothetical protein